MARDFNGRNSQDREAPFVKLGKGTPQQQTIGKIGLYAVPVIGRWASGRSE